MNDDNSNPMHGLMFHVHEALSSPLGQKVSAQMFEKEHPHIHAKITESVARHAAAVKALTKKDKS